jgi:hypothetical protein
MGLTLFQATLSKLLRARSPSLIPMAMLMKAEVVESSVVEVRPLFWTEVIIHKTRRSMMPPSLRISLLLVWHKPDKSLPLDEEISSKISNEHGGDPHISISKSS